MPASLSLNIDLKISWICIFLAGGYRQRLNVLQAILEYY